LYFFFPLCGTGIERKSTKKFKLAYRQAGTAQDTTPPCTRSDWAVVLVWLQHLSLDDRFEVPELLLLHQVCNLLLLFLLSNKFLLYFLF
jgi:hypothetical protein